MRNLRLLLPLVLLLTTSELPAVEPAELKPGLIATYRDGPMGRSITRLEPTVAITLGKGESPHPALASGRQIIWKGHLNIARAGKYKFSAVTEGGRLEIRFNGFGKLLNAEHHFDGGVMPFEATFTPTPGAGSARVELFWQGPGFIKEPLAYQFLGHLPKERPKEYIRDGQLEHGRFLFEELSCAKCHTPAASDKLVIRDGPDLTEIGKRAYPAWIYTWLADPRALHSHAAMPALFPNTDAGAAERFAITQYLVSLSGKPLETYKLPLVPSNDIKQSMDRGRVLYHVTGCAACHNDPIPKKLKDEEEEPEPFVPANSIYGMQTLAGPAAKYDLGALGSKYRPETLAAYLQNPLKTNPAGRMPHMNLSANEANDIARYLCRTADERVEHEEYGAPEMKPTELAATVFPGATAAEKKKFAALKPESQWLELGAKLIETRGCVNCHAIAPGGKTIKPTGTAPALAHIKQAESRGCLDAIPESTMVPIYTLAPEEHDALTAFLTEGFTGAGSPAPTYHARVALKRFNCLNCHQRDGEGGITVELAEQMRLLEKAVNADDVRPPVLTGIAHKVRTTWLNAVLTKNSRARPWMQLRMPQYGDAKVGFLPEALAYLEGTLPDDTVHGVERTAAKLAAGRLIVGKSGLGCISCHDIGGIANTGTRGPELATINQRVRYEWFERWLTQPLRMAPGTRMPQAFVDGHSVLKTVYNGDPRQQAEAMWAYLSLGPGLPLPDGLEPPAALMLSAKERPVILRTFLSDAGSKAIAVGYPEKVSLAFSADQCRTAYAWAGGFLDAAPVWNNRGGAPAKILGQRFWTAPPGHPWGLTSNTHLPPDFLARVDNPAFGKPLPLDPPRIHDGPMAVQFDGYSLDTTGKPTFNYRLNELGKDAVLKVSETPQPLFTPLAVGLGRDFDTTLPGGFQAWFLAGITGKEPRLFDTRGKQVKLVLKDGATAATDGTRVLLPDGDLATVLEATGLPAGSVWFFVQSKSGWLALLRLSHSKDDQHVHFTLKAWALPKDDDGLLKELLTK